MSKLLVFGVILALAAVPVCSAVYTETFESYSTGALAGQNGWVLASGSGAANIYADNGPSVAGTKCVRLDNLSGSSIRLTKNISNLVASDKILTIQYDVKNVTNNSGKAPTTFRMRVLDSALGYAAIGNMHYDGGADPACQAWAWNSNAVPPANGWAPGGPAWHDTGWHTVIWRLNYETKEFVAITFDGTQYPQPGWYFQNYGTSPANRADRMELYLNGPDGSNDIWEIDNIILTSTPIPQPITIAEAKHRTLGAVMDVKGTVSALFDWDSPARFYMQDEDNPCGIQVRYTESPPAVGQSVVVNGQLASDPDTHELYIQASSWQATGFGTAKTFAMNTRSLGGGAFGNQEAVTGGYGINNVGLLVKLAGKVTSKSNDYSYIYVNDGSGISDGSGNVGVRIDLRAINAGIRPQVAVGDNVVFSGISSMYSLGGGHHRTVRVRSGSDFSDLNFKKFKAYVLNFDPVVPSEGGKKTHQVFNWNDPHNLAPVYINDLKECSAGFAEYQIVEWYEANYHPICQDGYQFTPDGYVTAWRNGGPWHGDVDYLRLVTDKVYPHNNPRSIAERVAAGEIDEVFVFAAPSSAGFYESRMIGPTAYWCNSPGLYLASALRNFIVMGFNYERGVGEMLEDYGHRTESIMWHVYGSWHSYPPQHNWDKFTLIDKNITNHNLYTAGCGNVHYAPNSQSDYDWGNSTYVWSTCDDWLYNWPNLTGTKKLVNKNEWGGGDIRLHHKWWFKHFPRAAGINPDGKQNNWWKYLADHWNYPESR